MNKTVLGIILGSIVGIIDMLPMIIMGLPWDANISAFTHWILVGFFISTTEIKIKGTLKGIAIAIITLAPIAFLVWWHDTSSILPMSASTLIYGALLGFLIEKHGK